MKTLWSIQSFNDDIFYNTRIPIPSWSHDNTTQKKLHKIVQRYTSDENNRKAPYYIGNSGLKNQLEINGKKIEN